MSVKAGDAHVLPEGCSLRVVNDARGHRRLIAWLSQYAVSLIAIEATGKWHRQVHRMLHARGFQVAVVNPRRARLFAEAIGLLAKTDRLDARMLALLAVDLSPPARAPAPEAIEALQELVAGRDSAVAEQTALENQLAAATTTFFTRQLKARIVRIAKDIASLQTEIERRIGCDEALARRYAILISIPGVGRGDAHSQHGRARNLLDQADRYARGFGPCRRSIRLARRSAGHPSGTRCSRAVFCISARWPQNDAIRR